MRLTIVLLSVLLASCGSFSVPLLTPYKMDIRQGNYVTKEMRDKLKIGMSKSQVKYVLGSPLVNDAFHGNRWDYIYRLEHDYQLAESQRLTLYFEGDTLARIDDSDLKEPPAPAASE